MSRSITIEDGHAVIRIPIEDVHSLNVALQPCPCRAPKSNGTSAIREALSKGLARLLAGKGRR